MACKQKCLVMPLSLAFACLAVMTGSSFTLWGFSEGCLRPTVQGCHAWGKNMHDYPAIIWLACCCSMLLKYLEKLHSNSSHWCCVKIIWATLKSCYHCGFKQQCFSSARCVFAKLKKKMLSKRCWFKKEGQTTFVSLCFRRILAWYNICDGLSPQITNLWLHILRLLTLSVLLVPESRHNRSVVA